MRRIGWVIAGAAALALPALAQVTSTPVLVGTGSALAVAAKVRALLYLGNDSATATISCAFGTPAVLNGAGTVTLGPLGVLKWDTQPVPGDVINCIASAGNAPLTIMQ